jgi:oxepin-CoA hydrolase/3-oxo-5,6-dehydrosuberyl-CoA semialdehyde dehydrogenase
MTEALRSFLAGAWHEGGDARPLVNPTSGEVLAEAGSGGLDLGAALAHARLTGGPALRAMSFAQRGALLGAMASTLHEHREALIELSIANGGNTRGDAKFDIDGATSTLSWYAKLGERLGDQRLLSDGEPERMARNPRLVGQHVWVPRMGAAVHINAFNFPAWGMFEKAAVSLLAGVPVLSKPATATALLAVRAVELLDRAGVLPAGVLSLLAGSSSDLLDHLSEQDVVAFTGSAATGLKIRGHRSVLEHSVRVNVEADSLNAAVLAPDVEPRSETWELFLREVARDLTQKAGQKCTAIRRIFVPAQRFDEARRELVDELALTRHGNPALREVRMGPLTNADQLTDVERGIALLLEAGAEVITGADRGEVVGVREDRGYFLAPTLLAISDPDASAAVHEHEIFGPVASLMPYDGAPTRAAELVARGKGSLISSVYTDDRDFAAEAVLGAEGPGMAPFLGRLHLGSARIAEHSLGPGTVLPQLVHGGPGRAGGGEELGGARGLSFYSQRCAIQGEKTLLEKILR